MLVSSYVQGFGQAAVPMTLVQYFERARARQQFGYSSGFGGFGAAKCPEIVANYNAFDNGQASPSCFQGDPAGFQLGDVVFCNKEAGTNRPQCLLNKAGDAAKASIRAMQNAVDRIITLVNTQLRNQLANDLLCAEVPREDQSGTFKNCQPIGELKNNPIATGGGGGIDGIVGDSTMKSAPLALTFAGALKQIPNRNVAIAFINFGNNAIYAQMSQDIAGYLNDVANNFTNLVAAFKARGDKPIQTQLDPATIEALPFVVPASTRGTAWRPIGTMVGVGAAMIGLTAIGAVAAAKHKPTALYKDDEFQPAFGRRRHRGLRPRGW